MLLDIKVSEQVCVCVPHHLDDCEYGDANCRTYQQSLVEVAPRLLDKRASVVSRRGPNSSLE